MEYFWVYCKNLNFFHIFQDHEPEVIEEELEFNLEVPEDADGPGVTPSHISAVDFRPEPRYTPDWESDVDSDSDDDTSSSTSGEFMWKVSFYIALAFDLVGIEAFLNLLTVFGFINCTYNRFLGL